MKILVTHGSERGGTAELAERVATALRACGHDVDHVPAREVHDVTPYGAVIVGGALYALHWHADARRFVTRHAKALCTRDVWFFSSGPLDDSASRSEIPPTPQVAELMRHVSARGHVTFGGRLAPDARGFPASAMARKSSGDWRDWSRVARWATDISAALDAPRPERIAPRPLPSRALPLGLCLFTGLTAVAGGAVLLASPTGALVHMPASALAHSPFHDFLVPGLLLFTLVGLLNVWAAREHAIRADYAAFFSFAAGCSITIWIVVEMLMLRTAHPLQFGYLAIGVATIADATVRLRKLFAAWGTMATAARKSAAPNTPHDAVAS